MDLDLAGLVDALRSRGAVFAFLHGSRTTGTARPDSDLDVAAWFGTPVDEFAVARGLPPQVDLVVLDTAPLWLAGRVALHGHRILDDDPAARVAWQAVTRRRHLDETLRWARIREDYLVAHGRP